MRDRQDSSDEQFVAHFRTEYDDRMPIWALTEILELGHLARLYGGLRNDVATRIALRVRRPDQEDDAELARLGQLRPERRSTPCASVQPEVGRGPGNGRGPVRYRSSHISREPMPRSSSVSTTPWR
ncbi:Abi family protein [Curtobacterium flaccumfaciens]|nr:Abi family protein [Curtobacterium flaccumfaciens]